jgi:hypothetical protein
MQWADPYPLMFSVGKSEEGPLPDLEDHYKTDIPKYSYFEKDEYFYEDSNFHRNPFHEEEEDLNFNPIKKSNSYEILGLSEDSDEDDIKKAFRKKAKETHPDRGGDPADFREVREAYEILIQ